MCGVVCVSACELKIQINKDRLCLICGMPLKELNSSDSFEKMNAYGFSFNYRHIMVCTCWLNESGKKNLPYSSQILSWRCSVFVSSVEIDTLVFDKCVLRLSLHVWEVNMHFVPCMHSSFHWKNTKCYSPNTQRWL